MLLWSLMRAFTVVIMLAYSWLCSRMSYVQACGVCLCSSLLLWNIITPLASSVAYTHYSTLSCSVNTHRKKALSAFSGCHFQFSKSGKLTFSVSFARQMWTQKMAACWNDVVFTVAVLFVYSWLCSRTSYAQARCVCFCSGLHLQYIITPLASSLAYTHLSIFSCPVNARTHKKTGLPVFSGCHFQRLRLNVTSEYLGFR